MRWSRELPLRSPQRADGGNGLFTFARVGEEELWPLQVRQGDSERIVRHDPKILIGGQGGSVQRLQQELAEKMRLVRAVKLRSEAKKPQGERTELRHAAAFVVTREGKTTLDGIGRLTGEIGD